MVIVAGFRAQSRVLRAARVGAPDARRDPRRAGRGARAGLAAQPAPAHAAGRRAGAPRGASARSAPARAPLTAPQLRCYERGSGSVVRRLLLVPAAALLRPRARACRGAGEARRVRRRRARSGRATVWKAKVPRRRRRRHDRRRRRGDGTTRARRIRFTGRPGDGADRLRRPAPPGRLPRGRGDASGWSSSCAAAKGRVRLAAEDPLSMSRTGSVRTVAVRSGGRWTRRRHDCSSARASRCGGRRWRSRRRTRRTRVLAQEARAAGRGLLRPGRVRRRPERRLAAEAVGQLGRGRRDTANAAGEWVKIRNLDPVNAGAAGRLVRARLGAAPLHVPGRTPSMGPGGDGDRRTWARTSDGVSVFAWDQRAPVFEQRLGGRRRDGRRRLPVRSARQHPRLDDLPVPLQLHGPAAGRDRDRRRPRRAARVGHAHERVGRRRSTSTATCSRARRRATTSGRAR